MRDVRDVEQTTVAAALHRHLGRELPPMLTLFELGLVNPPIQFTEPVNGLDGSVTPEEREGWTSLGDVVACCRQKQTRVILANRGIGIMVSPEAIIHRTQVYPPHILLELLGMTPAHRTTIAAELSTTDVDGCGPLCAPLPPEEVEQWQTVGDIIRTVSAHLIWPNHFTA